MLYERFINSTGILINTWIYQVIFPNRGHWNVWFLSHVLTTPDTTSLYSAHYTMGVLVANRDSGRKFSNIYSDIFSENIKSIRIVLIIIAF